MDPLIEEWTLFDRFGEYPSVLWEKGIDLVKLG